MALTPIQILSTATGVAQKDGESRAQFLIRLIQSVGDLSDSAWEALDVETQNWFNAQAALVNDGKAVEDIPDPKPEPKPVSEARAAQRNRTRTASTAAAATTSAAAADTKAGAQQSEPATTKAATSPTPATSPTQHARTIMMLDEQITPSDVRARLAAESVPSPAMSALQAMRSDTRACLRILREHGKLKE